MLTSIAGFDFADDTDLLQTSCKHNDTIEDTVEEIQGSLDIRQGSLRTSSGTLEYDDTNKTYWYSVDYE